jgi:hypothetical protein
VAPSAPGLSAHLLSGSGLVGVCGIRDIGRETLRVEWRHAARQAAGSRVQPATASPVGGGHIHADPTARTLIEARRARARWPTSSSREERRCSLKRPRRWPRLHIGRGGHTCRLPRVHRVDDVRVLHGDRLAFELEGGRELVAARNPLGGQDAGPAVSATAGSGSGYRPSASRPPPPAWPKRRRRPAEGARPGSTT